LAYATGSTGLAITVRGSSRRIMIMRFRPANIRLINRRSKLLRLLLVLSSGKQNANHQNNPTDLAQLTRSLHIRPMHSLRLVTGPAQAQRSHPSLSPATSAFRDTYGWVEQVLVEQQFPQQGNAARDVVSHYIEKMIGLSRVQVTRLVAAWP
jgi:hypothetical protein